MRELQQKQKFKRRLYSTPVLIILLVLTLFIIKGTYEVLKKDRESAKYVSDLKTRITDLNNKDTELKTNIERLGTEEGVDTLIKEKFSVTKEGEKVAVIVDQTNASNTEQTTTDNWFVRLWRGFLDLW